MERTLNYYQLSPVRGQLEPVDPATRSGWRFIQCTDTPNQLKVLLPPRTATLYAHLLKVEAAELAKGESAGWPRIMEIRHLKDRMIRKCQRIALPQQQSQTTDSTFRTVYAPPDFRLKEMERWIKNNVPNARSKTYAPPAYPPAEAAARPVSSADFQETETFPVLEEPGYPRVPSPMVDGPAADAEIRQTQDSFFGDHLTDEPRDFSPDPIPVPYRQHILSPLHEHPDELGAFSDLGPPAPPSDAPIEVLDRRPIIRRRSSLKRQTSASKLSANGSAGRGVVFAMDLSAAEIAAHDVESAGIELAELREMFRTQLADIQHERMGISEMLQRLHMQEDSLRHQEERMHATFQELEQRELGYRNKVLAVLEETKRVVQQQKREQQAIPV